MRLDHLLSTEFFFRTPVRRPSCGPRAGDRLRFGVGVLVWKRSLASRVPFRGPGSGADMLLGSRTATRDLVACGFPDVPLGRSAGRCAVSGSFLGCVVV